MKDLPKRVFSAIILLTILYLALINNHILFFLIFLISFVVLIEFFNLVKKILNQNKKKILILYLITIVYLSFFLTQLFLFIIANDNNKLFFIYFLFICIATDTGGYICGKIFKGKKLTKISPNKTYSGLIGSFIFSIIIFCYFYIYLKLGNSQNLLLLTLIICSISQMGDLFISYLKRKAKIKDTGHIIPGHGGILDRLDGILFALPAGINLLFLIK